MKILATLLLLFLVTGCQRPAQRFVPMGNDNGIALDTKTGLACNSYPKEPGDTGPPNHLPICYDLFKANK